MDQRTWGAGPPEGLVAESFVSEAVPAGAAAVRSRPEGHVYRAPDLLPAAGPERSLAFVIMGVPLVLSVVIGILGASLGSTVLSHVPVLSTFFSSAGSGSASGYPADTIGPKQGAVDPVPAGVRSWHAAAAADRQGLNASGTAIAVTIQVASAKFDGAGARFTGYRWRAAGPEGVTWI